MKISTKDMVDGAEELKRRFVQRLRGMTYEQIEDEGGFITILNRELVKMSDEWCDEVDRDYSNKRPFDYLRKELRETA